MHRHRLHIEPVDPALTATEYHATGAEFRLFVLVSGRATIEEGQNTTEHRAPCVFWTSHGEKSCVRLQSGARGHLLLGPISIIQAALPTGQVAGFVQRATSRTFGVSMDHDDRFKQVLTLMQLLQSQAKHADPLADAIAQSTVSSLICLVLKASPELEAKTAPLPRRVLHEFARLVELHLYDHWSIERYAKEIGVTRDHLQLTVRKQARQAPLEYVHRRMTETASSILMSSNLTVAEVAYRLGFSDAGYFNRFFKRQTGMPPGEFRRTQVASNIAPPALEEFSSWP